MRGSVDSDIIYTAMILYTQYMEAVSFALDPCSLLGFREQAPRVENELQVLVSYRD